MMGTDGINVAVSVHVSNAFQKDQELTHNTYFALYAMINLTVDILGA